ncbi:hypothetical protein F2Q68_00014740 [Brassica cretica]|uniref:Uncharacterized protein n=1 Tax=Brassica cretica TaxID=69181 RepID=A0A8S9HKK5_BRACR|nr:hypothetical protein F2Q68_00014740 [Brassica cretica]
MIARATRPKNAEPHFVVKTKIRKPLKKPERKKKSQPKGQRLNKQKRQGDRAGITELSTPSSEEKSRHDFVGAKQQLDRRNQEPDRRKNSLRDHGSNPHIGKNR